ncbi:hypothetical protein [Sinosporangium siamense]|uniref:Uncharacterized protein n=1 Tax=Sinosporangium siamense TaxID=1367973 RepID=A0A919V7V7_9ACTN|nr:hypothetical protein [Sinosporangium siamense]GII92522.1 hypothetical protein Ssi02_27530 [Sinosporangium siamense]
MLVFTFGPWSLVMQDDVEGLDFDQRMTWARSLRGEVDRDGWLTLSAEPPLTLRDAKSSSLRGPHLVFADRHRALALMPHESCARFGDLSRLPFRDRPGAISRLGPEFDKIFCRGDYLVWVTGDPEYTEGLRKGFRITPR